MNTADNPSPEAYDRYMNYLIEIPGLVVGKGRPRFSMKGGYPRTYTPAKTAEWEERIQWYCRQARIVKQWTGGVGIKIGLYFEIKGLNKTDKAKALAGILKPIKKPDIDNCLKTILDALNGFAYADDRQVVWVQIKKYYALEAKTIIEIFEE